MFLALKIFTALLIESSPRKQAIGFLDLYFAITLAVFSISDIF
jgi:hypothetical protein